MELKKTHLFLSSIVTMLFVALYPLAKILFKIKNVTEWYFGFCAIFYFLLMIIMFILDLAIVVYFIRYIVRSNIKKKPLWIILIILFNIFIIPYFYMKYVEKEGHIVFNVLLYIIPIVFYLAIFGYGMFVFTDLNAKKIERERIIENTRNTYVTKDNKAKFTFRYGYEQKEVGEYDLYVINEADKVVFSAFTYNIIDYEQKTAEEYLNIGIEDVKAGKKSFTEFTKKEEISSGVYTINTVSYEGKKKKKNKKKTITSDCIYKLSTITLNGEPDYIIFVMQVVTKANYEKYKDQLTETLKSVSRNIN